MSVQWVVPHQSRFAQTGNVFTASFNVPTVGVYDFGVAANRDVVVLELQPNTQYLIERLTIGGDISEADYAGALALAAGAPSLSLRRRLDGVTVYETPIPILRYIQNQEAAVWLASDNAGDALTATLTGVMNQTAALVGISSIALSVSFAVYAVESTIYNRAFLGSQSMETGARVRRGD